MKRLLPILALVLFSKAYSQDQKDWSDSSLTIHKNEIKGNVLFASFGIANIGYERVIGKHWTAQADVFISPWKSFAHNHMQIYMGNLEMRYYFGEAMKRFYIGGDIGLTFFDLQKWNYLNTNKYQRGYNTLIGVVVGYKLRINDRWQMETYLKVGNSQGHYHGYLKDTNPPLRYESHPGKYNISGEWIPYGGGVMLSYGF